MLLSVIQLSAQNGPLITPIHWQGLDTLSKFYQHIRENTGKGTLQCAPTALNIILYEIIWRLMWLKKVFQRRV